MIGRIVAYLERTTLLDSPPSHIRALAEEAFRTEHPPLRAFELAERHADRLLTRLSSIRNTFMEDGVDPWFEFNSANPDYVQGPCYAEPSDPPELREAKGNRLRCNPMKQVLESLSFADFETVCAGMLALLGVREPKKTVRSHDQGIDFYGLLTLGDLSATEFPFFRLQDHIRVWIVGQAKHYVGGKVSTPEVRNLVGSVSLARFKEYASTSDLMKDLPLRSCDPVLAVFLTTGMFTRDASTLARNSGVMAKHIGDLSKFLADNKVGLDSAGCVTKAQLLEWAANAVS